MAMEMMLVKRALSAASTAVRVFHQVDPATRVQRQFDEARLQAIQEAAHDARAAIKALVALAMGKEPSGSRSGRVHGVCRGQSERRSEVLPSLWGDDEDTLVPKAQVPGLDSLRTSLHSDAG
jgi:hypothetical protein